MAGSGNIGRRVLTIAALLVFVFMATGAWWFYRVYYQPNVQLPEKESGYLYVHTGTTMPELVSLMKAENIVQDTSSFMVIARLKKFNQPRPGRYRIRNGMNNRELVNLLRAGLQEPVQVTFSSVRTKEDLAGRVGSRLEADSMQLIFLLNDPGFLNRYNMTPSTILTLFIPDTYEFKWNTSAETFVDRMADEYKKFWTDERRQKARNIGLSQSEVVILASIVEAEQTRFPGERPAIAGLYLNRLRKNMPLQSDPTVIYAKGDFSVQRVYKGDLDIDSPYNTYLYTGLPPGPIRLPERRSIDAVLNYQTCDYLYMCAEYGTGQHKFSSDYDAHLKNAREYQKALDRAQIR